MQAETALAQRAAPCAHRPAAPGRDESGAGLSAAREGARVRAPVASRARTSAGMAARAAATTRSSSAGASRGCALSFLGSASFFAGPCSSASLRERLRSRRSAARMSRAAPSTQAARRPRGLRRRPVRAAQRAGRAGDAQRQQRRAQGVDAEPRGGGDERVDRLRGAMTDRESRARRRDFARR